MARESKMKVVVRSTDLKSYSLPKTLNERFKSFDKMCDYCLRGGRTPPPHVRLARVDFADLKALVLQQSEGRHSIEAVRWNGYAIVSD